jgi:uncharacterized membrane protein YeaQ/YmgE (transglycosylase-associated protein family)
MTMIGMNFVAFVTLLVLSLIASLIVHFAIRYRLLDSFDGFLWKWVVGWIGGWLGSPVLGHWFDGLKLANVYIIPALLGAFGAFVATMVWKAEAKVSHRTT